MVSLLGSIASAVGAAVSAYKKKNSSSSNSTSGGSSSSTSSKSSSGGSAGSNSAVPASDGKYYATGGSGKEYVYNPSTGNIGITYSDGSIKYVKPEDSGYNVAFKAMQADTGHTYGTENSAASATSGSDYKDWNTYSSALQTSQQMSLIEYNKQMNSLYSALEKAQKNNDLAIEASVQAAIDKLEAQKPQILQNQEEANTSAYNAYMQGVNPYGVGAEANALLGLGDSGYAESSLVNLGNAYQSAINENEELKQTLLAELEEAKEQAILSGDIAKAEAAVEYSKQLISQKSSAAETMLQTKLEQQDALQQAAWQNWQNSLAEEKLAQDKGNDDQSKLLAQAQLAAKYGNTDILADILGVDSSTLKQAVTSAKSSSGSSSGSSSLTYAQALSAYKAGISSSAVTSVLKKYLGNNFSTILGDNDTGSSDDSLYGNIDAASVTALGYGPISATRLAELINSGEVSTYTNEKTGKIYVYRTGEQIDTSGNNFLGY